MEFIGFIAAVIMGLSLGLIGGGGSILTVPILVYIFEVDPVIATAYSLFVVGLTSLAGSYGHFKNNNVHFKTAIIFGIPSIITVYVVRKFLVPAILDIIFTSSSFVLTKSILLMLIFGVLMLLASFSMIRKSKSEENQEKEIRYNYPLIFIEGLLVGGVTGLVGAGGGFLIIPALVLLTGLPMKLAVGTSLLIIASKSLIGFTGDLNSGLTIDYIFLLTFSAFAMAGIFLGTYLAKFIPNEKLKPAFGWFVLVMGIYILTKELFFNQ